MRTPFKLRSSGPFKQMGSTEKKKGSSPEMKAKVKEVRDQNFIDTNKALVEAGKAELSRAEYDASLK